MEEKGAAGPQETAGGLQFEQIELSRAAAAPRTCSGCRKLIEQEYFEAGGKLLCQVCAKARQSGGKSAFFRALALGSGAAFLGTAVWFAIIKLTDSELGIIAIAVGLLVGAAVRRGARGAGGWKYQALAMALTYVSITASYVPFVIKGIAESAKAKPDKDAGKAAPAKPEGAAAGLVAPKPDGAASAAAPEAAPHSPLVSIAILLAIVFGIALASPFLAGASNLMGWVMIAIAIYEAWKLNRHVVMNGPFSLAPPEAVVAVPGDAPTP